MISVCIATYGGSEWEHLAWERAYTSVVAQAPHAPIVMHHEPEGTRATSLNNAAEQATQPWLLFLDADDDLDGNYLTAMQRALEQHDDYRTLFTPSVQQIRKGRPGRPFFFPECLFTTGNWIVIGTMISRQLFMEIGGVREHPHGLEDWNLWARAVRAGATIVKVPDAVYRAHINPRSKHHLLVRNRPEYMRAYEAARLDAWG